MKHKSLLVVWPILFVFALLWSLVAIALLRKPTPVTQETEWIRSFNEEYGFSVEHPNKWTARVYGQQGFRGATEVKLELYDSLLGAFRIFVSQKEARQPTPQNVAQWGMSLINEGNEIMTGRGETALQEIDFGEETMQGTSILRRRYGNERYLFEDVYIARDSDMIIITLQATASEFDRYTEDFNRVVASFDPFK